MSKHHHKGAKPNKEKLDQNQLKKVSGGIDSTNLGGDGMTSGNVDSGSTLQETSLSSPAPNPFTRTSLTQKIITATKSTSK